jgi:GT2 family glycosyltransferase
VGYEIGYCNAVKITHIAGASEFGASSLDKWLRKKRGIWIFYTKHFDPRDTLAIAKSTIFKSKLYLAALYIENLFCAKNSEIFLDKKHRLQASIISANEALNQSKLRSLE